MQYQTIEETELAERARQIRWLFMDVDGVMTDGRLWLMSDGSECKSFDTRDGLGIRFAQDAGLQLGLISGRASEATLRRARELDFAEIHLDKKDKLAVFQEIAERRGIEAHQAAYIGDDLVDIPLLRHVGVSCTVPDASVEVKQVAHVITSRRGGRGAVREFIEALLTASGHWPTILAKYGVES